jgi:hypothetical protein
VPGVPASGPGQPPRAWQQGLKFGLLVGGGLSLIVSLAALNFGGAAVRLDAWFFSTLVNFGLATAVLTALGWAGVVTVQVVRRLLAGGANH